MQCPLCQAATQVTDSRRQPDNSVRRRRACIRCRYRFSTWERTPDVIEQTVAELRALTDRIEQQIPPTPREYQPRPRKPRLVPPEEAAA